MQQKRIVFSLTSGFCAGASRAVDGLNQVCKAFPDEIIYVRHAILHNPRVLDEFTNKNVIFIEEMSEVPDSAILVLSAHGSAPDVYREAKRRNITVFDAVCPLVLTTHKSVEYWLRQGCVVVFVGQRGHQEVIGIMGLQTEHPNLHLVSEPADIELLRSQKISPEYFATQTTLSNEELEGSEDGKGLVTLLRQEFPQICGIKEHVGVPHNLCFATTNRQHAVRELSRDTTLTIVIGSTTSSNSVRLARVAKSAGNESILINCESELDREVLDLHDNILVTAGASAPPALIEEIKQRILEMYPSIIWEEERILEETETFPPMKIEAPSS